MQLIYEKNSSIIDQQVPVADSNSNEQKDLKSSSSEHRMPEPTPMQCLDMVTENSAASEISSRSSGVLKTIHEPHSESSEKQMIVFLEDLLPSKLVPSVSDDKLIHQRIHDFVKMA
jgi:hypothetical protein